MWFTPLIDDFLTFGSKAKRDSLKSKGGLLRAALGGGTFRERLSAAGSGFKGGWSGMWGGWAPITLPIAAFAAGSAPTGHKLSTFTGAALPSVGTLIGSAFGGGIGGVVGSVIIDPLLQKTVTRGMQAVHDIGRNSVRLHTGGDYVDTQRALTMRQAASQQMANSLLNARTYLGREAAYFAD